MRSLEKTDKTELFEGLPRAVREEAARIAREIAYQRTLKRETAVREAILTAKNLLNMQRENKKIKESL